MWVAVVVDSRRRGSRRLCLTSTTEGDDGRPNGPRSRTRPSMWSRRGDFEVSWDVGEVRAAPAAIDAQRQSCRHALVSGSGSTVISPTLRYSGARCRAKQKQYMWRRDVYARVSAQSAALTGGLGGEYGRSVRVGRRHGLGGRRWWWWRGTRVRGHLSRAGRGARCRVGAAAAVGGSGFGRGTGQGGGGALLVRYPTEWCVRLETIPAAVRTVELFAAERFRFQKGARRTDALSWVRRGALAWVSLFDCSGARRRRPWENPP